MTDPDLDRFDSRRSTVYAPSGVVATSQPLASMSGISVLRDGGNAFDAAVATAASLNVVEPTSTGLGGDVFALYRTAGDTIEGMQSCGSAPGDATAQAVRDRVAEDQGIDPTSATMPHTGPHTVTVPGTARGWEAILDRHGTMDLETVLEPVIRYAKDGFPVTEVVSSQWEQAEELFDDPHAREAYLFDGEAPKTGQTVSLPRLGRSLELVAERGADVVYEGELGAAIVEEVQSKGGLLSRSDMASHEARFVDPISTTYRDVDVFELPPTNQGLVALEALNVAEALEGTTARFGSVEYTHSLIEAMKIAFHDGHHHIADPDFESVPDLASTSYARRRASSVSEMAREDVSVGYPDATGENADTVMLSVGDAEGNLVSFINSRYDGFGSGLVAGETGIALQNRGASFSLDEDDPNAIEPGKRPFHTLIPGIARFDDNDHLAFGVMGGFMQPQGHLQVLTNLVDGDLPLQTALDRPRWRYRSSGRLAVEERMGNTLPTKLARRGHSVEVLPPSEFGGAQAVRLSDGVLSAATEPRKDGAALGL
ncbi:MAG: gamma-glutamyltransferase family protein [Halodesulfurarchaeum sp.]